jgi:hypothetical protein
MSRRSWGWVFACAKQKMLALSPKCHANDALAHVCGMLNREVISGRW